MGAKVLNEPPLCLVCSADLYVPHGRPSSRHVKLYIVNFMHKICARVVCVNGKYPGFLRML